MNKTNVEIKVDIDIDIIKAEINKIDFNDKGFVDNLNIEKKDGNRSKDIFAQPKNDSFPFLSSSKRKTEKGFQECVSLIWTIFEENKPPNSASSKTAKRNNPDLPSVIQYNINTTDGVDKIEIKEVLYVRENGYSRYIFENNILLSMWNFFDKGVDKMYDLNDPIYILFHPNGNKKEVWYFNPKAQNFKEAAATIKMTDDKPVVISYYEDGVINELDYTGYVFSKKIHPSINAFPFGSRFSFFKPSYIKYHRDSSGGILRVVNKYFYQQIEKDKDIIYDTLEGFGVDTSSDEGIKETLDSNPMFDDLIREMLGVAILKEEELDIFNSL